MNIFVLGFMGTGKTTIGSTLAEQIGYSWIDLDHYLVQRAGRAIPDIFRVSGEAYFRDLETECLEEVSCLKNHVVTTGGGVVIRQKNREIMKSSGYRITLTASVECISHRLREDTQRPLLKANPLQQIQKLMAERASFYADTDVTIDTTDRTIEDILQEILCHLSDRRVGV